MKIQRLNEHCKETMRFRLEEYDDDTTQMQAALGIEVPQDANPVYLIDVSGEYVLEITLEQISAILKANGYEPPQLMGGPQAVLMEYFERRRKQK